MRIVAAGFLASFTLLATPIMARADDPSTPEPRPRAPGWMQRHQQKLAELKQDGGPRLLLIGDSIIQELELAHPAENDIAQVWQQFYVCRNAVNLGFRGDTTSNVLWRLDNGEAAGISPRLAVLMIGTNNIRPKIESTVAAVVGGIRAVVEDLHRRLPATRILLLGIPPADRGAATEDKRLAVNQSLAARDWSADNASFLSIDPALMHDGKADDALFRTTPKGLVSVHPNQQGWRNIAERIEPQVAAALADRRCHD